MPPSPALLSGCRVGANPIIWSNDDFAELAGDVPLDVILADMRACGFAGSELGHAYPRDTAALGQALGRHGLQLASGWHSTYLASGDLAREEEGFRTHAALLKSLGADVAIVAECTRAIHGERNRALGFGDHDRPLLTESEWQRMVSGLRRLTEIARGDGMTVAYHHHMGTVVQTASELDHLLADVPGLGLVLDPGHLAFAGIDPMSVVRRHGRRVAHAHLKSVRAEVRERAVREGWSFCRAVSEGVFTIPGDGMVDFPAIFAELAKLGYRGWLVVEAEEDPVKVPAHPKATRARDYVRTYAGV
jgi:inosose dehydratase